MITIVMPAYNSEKYIADSIRSVIDQTFKDWNLIVINDCSTDRTLEIVEEFQNEDRRINILNNFTNVGVGRSRNRGIEEAQSEWIAFLDSDDIWTPDKLEKQVKFLSSNQSIEMTFTGSSYINESGEMIGYVFHVPDKVKYQDILKQNVISCSSVLIKKDIMLQHYFSEEKSIHEDYAVWLAILENGGCAYGIDEPLLIYRISANSKSGNKIHAARMNWNTYSYVGLKNIAKIRSMYWYTLNGIRKRLSILAAKRRGKENHGRM